MKLQALPLALASFMMMVLLSAKADAQTISGWSRLPSDDWCTANFHCEPYAGRDPSIVAFQCNLTTPRFPDNPNGEGLCEFQAIICDDGNVATTDLVHPVTKQCGNWAPAVGSNRTLSGWSRLPSDDTCNSDYDCQPTLGRDASITAAKCTTTKHLCQFRQYVCDDGNVATQDVLNPRTKECGIWVPYHVPACDPPPPVDCNSECPLRAPCEGNQTCQDPPGPPPVCTVQCQSADDCNDGNACTADSCAAGVCHHAVSISSLECCGDGFWYCLDDAETVCACFPPPDGTE